MTAHPEGGFDIQPTTCNELVLMRDWTAAAWWMKPCDDWPGNKNDQGYGVKWTTRAGGQKRRMLRTHRLAWIAAFGEIPPERPHVCHRCDRPPCRELTHLFLGTPADNSWDKVRKGRHPQTNKTHCLKGHPLVEGNLVPSSLADGRRDCTTCSRARAREQKQRRKKPRVVLQCALCGRVGARKFFQELVMDQQFVTVCAYVRHCEARRKAIAREARAA
jgi:hypothetical protein